MACVLIGGVECGVPVRVLKLVLLFQAAHNWVCPYDGVLRLYDGDRSHVLLAYGQLRLLRVLLVSATVRCGRICPGRCNYRHAQLLFFFRSRIVCNMFRGYTCSLPFHNPCSKFVPGKSQRMLSVCNTFSRHGSGRLPVNPMLKILPPLFRTGLFARSTAPSRLTE